MRRRPTPMRQRPTNMRGDDLHPPDGDDLADWAWTRDGNAHRVRVILNRRTGIRHRVVWDEDYGLWFIEVGS